jgi:hypothetical protein
MMKNTVKLMMTITLVIGLGMSAFIKPAEAQRRKGNTYSQTNEDEQNVKVQFSLVNATRDGIPIDDAVGESNSIGLFIGAIENYAPAKGEICVGFIPDLCPLSSNSSPFNQNSRYFYDSSGFPIFKLSNPLSTTGIPFDGNLLAQFVEPGQELYSPGYSPASIAYSIFRPDSILGADEPVLSYRLLNLDSLDITQAVNSLEYILKNNLLGAAQPVIERSTDPRGNPITRLGIGNALVQNKFEEDVHSTVIPEPDTAITGLLGLGVLGAGSLLKRKMKPS